MLRRHDRCTECGTMGVALQHPLGRLRYGMDTNTDLPWRRRWCPRNPAVLNFLNAPQRDARADELRSAGYVAVSPTRIVAHGIDTVVSRRRASDVRRERTLIVHQARSPATHMTRSSGRPIRDACSHGDNVYSSMALTWPTTIRHPSSKRTHVWVIRPTLPGAVTRWKSVDATARSRPNVVITVFDSVRIRPAGERAARNASISL